MLTGDSLYSDIRIYLIKMFAGSKDYTREAHDKFYKEILKQQAFMWIGEHSCAISAVTPIQYYALIKYGQEISNIMTYMVKIGINVNDGNINKMKYRMFDAISNRFNREIEKHQALDINQFMESQFDDIVRYTLENMYVHE